MDAHEDISFNSVVLGRDFLSPAYDKHARERPPNPQVGTATIGLPELLQANVRVADALAQAHFIDKEINNILAGNWLRFLEDSLPPGTSCGILK